MAQLDCHIFLQTGLELTAAKAPLRNRVSRFMAGSLLVLLIRLFMNSRAAPCEPARVVHYRINWLVTQAYGFHNFVDIH